VADVVAGAAFDRGEVVEGAVDGSGVVSDAVVDGAGVVSGWIAILKTAYHPVTNTQIKTFSS
jgi:hypothetical protein